MLTPERRAEIERDLDGWESGAYPAGLSPHCLGACCAAARELLAEVGRLERAVAAPGRRPGQMADAAEAGQASPGGNAAV